MLSIQHVKSPLIDVGDIEVSPGACLALHGPSGAGKSMLLRAIVDLDPNVGDVRLYDCRRGDVPTPEWRRRVGLVPAESGWWTDIVGDHFAGCAGERDRITNLLHAVGLADEALTWQVARLSTGERHRLAIARALALKPQALLLDEPTAALDAENTARIEALLRRHMDNGLILVVVSHDRAQPKRLNARTMQLDAGRITPRHEADQ